MIEKFSNYKIYIQVFNILFFNFNFGTIFLGPQRYNYRFLALFILVTPNLYLIRSLRCLADS